MLTIGSAGWPRSFCCICAYTMKFISTCICFTLILLFWRKHGLLWFSWPHFCPHSCCLFSHCIHWQAFDECWSVFDWHFIHFNFCFFRFSGFLPTNFSPRSFGLLYMPFFLVLYSRFCSGLVHYAGWYFSWFECCP